MNGNPLTGVWARCCGALDGLSVARGQPWVPPPIVLLSNVTIITTTIIIIIIIIIIITPAKHPNSNLSCWALAIYTDGIRLD